MWEHFSVRPPKQPGFSSRFSSNKSSGFFSSSRNFARTRTNPSPLVFVFNGRTVEDENSSIDSFGSECVWKPFSFKHDPCHLCNCSILPFCHSILLGCFPDSSHLPALLVKRFYRQAARTFYDHLSYDYCIHYPDTKCYLTLVEHSCKRIGGFTCCDWLDKPHGYGDLFRLDTKSKRRCQSSSISIANYLLRMIETRC